jgi:glycosyltransferase involved in cell wall biosynthesis
MRPTICLNMIVKDESHVIRRCLDSVRPFIDCWAIVDTGSTDGTQDIIRKHLEDVPGELFERPWKNFGHNRSEALTLARGKADYTFILDADEVLELPTGFSRPPLTRDAYSLLFEHAGGGVQYWRLCLVAARLAWRYVGVLHEYLEVDTDYSQEKLPGPKVYSHFEGGRSKGVSMAAKYANDARILENALKDEPDNSRYVFYLARSYRDSDQWKKAFRSFKRRAAMGGWAEEVWHSLFEMARISERLELDAAVIVERYLDAYNYRPQRAEPLVELARFYREREQYAIAHLFAARALETSRPDDILFVDSGTYEWRALDEFAVASYWIGRYQASAQACEQLLQSGRLPLDRRARVTQNLNFALEKLGKASVAASGGTSDTGEPPALLHPYHQALE